MAEKLNTNQRRAIAALLTSKSIKAAAELADVGERTLYRWLTLPEFRTELSQHEGATIDQAARRLVELGEKAIDELESILGNTQAAEGLKLRAAQTVLDYLLKLRELRNIEQRLTELEARMK